LHTVVTATLAEGCELALLADGGARVCLCPTTEANLGDGYAPVEALLERGIGICIGSDSNVRVDPLEELRERERVRRRPRAWSLSRSAASARGSRVARPAAAR